MKSYKPNMAVFSAFLLTSKYPAINSFQMPTKDSKNAEVKPGVASGTTMSHNDVNGEQPSMNEASSSSRGIVSKKLFTTQILKGRKKPT